MIQNKLDTVLSDGAFQFKMDCFSGKTSEDGVHIPEELVARDMAHALVQIARGVEPRFMTHPLGKL